MLTLRCSDGWAEGKWGEARKGSQPVSGSPGRGVLRAGRLELLSLFRLEEAEGLGRSRPYLVGLLNGFPGSQEWPTEGRAGQAGRS